MSPRQEQSGVEKGPDAFRTISEVAEDLDLPQHVLRFWETRFPQIRPLKRGGGRRYYRPDDVELLRGIRHLLYGEGYTIRGVQRILKEEGPRYVQGIWRDVEADDQAIAGVDPREPGAARQAEALPVADAAPRTQDDAPRGGPLGGILNLLPGRQRDTVEEAPARRARRRPDDESDHLDLPLLADLEPPPRPFRNEPPPIGGGPVGRAEEPQRGEPRPSVEMGSPEIRPASLRPGYVEPRAFEPSPVELPAIEASSPELRQAELRPAESRPSFPFRPVGPGPVSPAAEDEESFVPERARAMPSAQAPFHAAAPQAPAPVTRSVPPGAQTLPRAGGMLGDEGGGQGRLSREDVQRLQAALYELQDCQRLLDAARDRGG